MMKPSYRFHRSTKEYLDAIIAEAVKEKGEPDFYAIVKLHVVAGYTILAAFKHKESLYEKFDDYKDTRQNITVLLWWFDDKCCAESEAREMGLCPECGQSQLMCSCGEQADDQIPRKRAKYW